MFYIFLEVSSFRQLHKLRGDTLDTIVNTFQMTLEREQAQLFAKLPSGVLIFRLEKPAKGSLSQAVEAMYHAYSYIKKHEEELNGFTMIVDRSIFTEPDRIIEQFEEYLFHIDDDNQFWIGPAAFANLEQFFVCERVGVLRKVLERKDTGKDKRGDVSGFWKRRKAIESILDEFFLYINGEKEPGAIILTGQPYTAKKYNINHALSQILTEEDLLPMRIYPGSRVSSGCEAFINSIQNDFVPEVDDYLTDTEKKVWKEKKTIFSRVYLTGGGVFYNQETEIDFHSAYELYFTAFLRLMREKLYPGIVVFEDFHHYSRNNIFHIQQLVNKFLGTQGFLPIVVSEDKGFDTTIFNKRYSSFNLKPLRLSEVEELITEFFPKLSEFDLPLNKILIMTSGRNLFLYHLLWLLEDDIDSEDKGVCFNKYAELLGAQISWQVLLRLGVSVQKVYYVLILAAHGSFDNYRKRLTDFVLQLSFENAEIKDYIGKLADFGFINLRKNCFPMFSEFREYLENLLEDDADFISSNLGKYLTELYKDRKYCDNGFLVSLLIKRAMFDHALDVFEYSTFNAVQTGVWEHGEENKQKIKAIRILRKEQKERFLALDYVLGIAKDLRLGSFENALTLFHKHNAHQLIDSTGVLYGDAVLNLSRCYLTEGKLKYALHWAKFGLVFFQNKKHLAETNANILLGLIMLAADKLEEGIEYFAIARNEAKLSDTQYYLVFACIFEACGQFIFGNYSRVVLLSTEAYELAEQESMHEWQVYAVFLAARAWFEVGMYIKASTFFQHGLAICRIYGYENAANVLSTWLGRCYIYSDSPETGIRLLQTRDRTQENLLFIAEAYVFLRRYEDALAVLDEAVENIQLNQYIPVDYPFWSDGFLCIEDRSLGAEAGFRVVSLIIKSLRAYVLGKMGYREKGISELYRITREEKISENDPYNSFYFFLYSLTLPESSNTDVDDNLTILSKSLKYLQERASRIDQTNHKKGYLYKNYWNKLLVEDAREKKLM